MLTHGFFKLHKYKEWYCFLQPKTSWPALASVINISPTKTISLINRRLTPARILRLFYLTWQEISGIIKALHVHTGDIRQPR
jgi:hypothetical protein